MPVGRPEPSHSADPPNGPAQKFGPAHGWIRRCTGLNDADLKQANPVGQAALHKAVVLHGPKSNLVGILEDDTPHDAAVKLLRLRKMLRRVPRPGKMDWPACVLVLNSAQTEIPSLSRHIVQLRAVSGCTVRKLVRTMSFT